MKAPRVPALVAMILAATSASGTAQSMSAELTIEVPLNLTKLPAELTIIQLSCSITSDAIVTSPDHTEHGEQVLNVTGGQLVTTAALVFRFSGLENPVGKSAFVKCDLSGATASAPTQYVYLSPTATNPIFRVSIPGDGSGLTTLYQFVWQ